ncbi:hypothetical protein CF15_00790 [Pyrodictium occultum]|uniref:Ribonuclease P protein component 3 n=1 Tax=Pyrodictium occultum TaxID=2309 RepID=A0A0V8RTN8_PYROC|nr:RNase P subunit p30 family protein [Pyrodictium occultum]KSW11428.1 hypothetical protein CF15_00790 [Pyrodictium occultum]
MKYIDLCLRPRSSKDAAEMASMAGVMGYRVVAVEAGDPEHAREYARIFREEGIEALTRATVEAESWSKAVGLVRRLAQSFDLVAVKPRTAEAARLAARHPRIALVVLPPGMARYMDKSQAHLLREGGAAVEIQLHLLLHGGDPRGGLRGSMIIARRAAAYEAPFTVTSCARTRWEMWHPRVVQALLAAFGLPELVARLAVTGYPAAVVNAKARRLDASGAA